MPVVKIKKRHGERGPGIKTLLTKAALNAAAAHPDLTPAEFLLSVMRDEKAEARWRMDAAKALLPKPQAAPPGDSGAMVIEHRRSAEEHALVAEAERQSDLRDRRELADLIDEPDPLTPEERDELAALDAKGDLFAALPQHLRPISHETDEDRELRELLRSDWLPEPPRHRTYENSGSHRQRLLSECHAPVERKAPALDDSEDGPG